MPKAWHSRNLQMNIGSNPRGAFCLERFRVHGAANFPALKSSVHVSAGQCAFCGLCPSAMPARFIRLLLCLVLVCGGVCGCANLNKKKDQSESQKEKDKKKKEEDKLKPKIPDMSGDVNFQSFVGRLRLAVSRHDRATLSQMMTPDFGYRWDPPMAGETCFDYWDQQNLWPELQKVLSQRFVPNGPYMVAPQQFVDESNYSGYRAGVRLVNGGWRFGYFISGQDPLP